MNLPVQSPVCDIVVCSFVVSDGPSGTKDWSNLLEREGPRWRLVRTGNRLC
jgi:hypothetical protein